jgi:hypothetical protein
MDLVGFHDHPTPFPPLHLDYSSLFCNFHKSSLGAVSGHLILILRRKQRLIKIGCDFLGNIPSFTGIKEDALHTSIAFEMVLLRHSDYVL